MEPSTPQPVKRRPQASSSSTNTPIAGPKFATTPRRPSVGTPKTPATTLKPKPPVPRMGMLTPQVKRPHRGSVSSADNSPAESRLYSGSVCYITEDLLKRVTKTKNLGEVKALKLSFPDSKVVHIENLDGLKRLEELDLSENKIEKMRNLQSLRYLRTLNLSSNLINSIDGVELLSRLQSLDLSGNLIERIPALAKHLGALSSLKLQNNKLSTLRDIIHLKQLKNLTELTISPNPIMELDHARLFIVFHLSCLNELDGQVISEAEREEARERFTADELQQIEFEMHAAQLEVQRLREQLVSKEQKIEALEAALKAKDAASDEILQANNSVQQELLATTALLDKKTAEVASLSELLYELKQEIAFHNIDSQFGSMPSSAARRGPFAPTVTESPYLGMGSARLRGSIDTPEKTMANLLSQLDAVAQEDEQKSAKDKDPTEEEDEEPIDDDTQPAEDDKLDTTSWIDENQPKDVSDELFQLSKQLEELQTQFYTALAEGRSLDAETIAAEIEQLKNRKILLESQQQRFEEWKAAEEDKQRAALEKSIAQLKAELQAKEEQLLQSKIKAEIDTKNVSTSLNNKAERRMSLEQLVKKDLPTETLAAAGGHDASASPQLREFLALVEQDHINRIVALIGEVSRSNDPPSDSGSPRSLDEAIQLLRKFLLSQDASAASPDSVNSPAREQGQPNPHDMSLVPLVPSDLNLPAHVRERLGQLEAQVSMLEDAKLETFFSEGEDWEQLAMAMKTLQQQTKLLNTANPPEVTAPADEEDRVAFEAAKQLKDQTTELQQKLAGNMAALKQMWLAGKIRADPEVEKSAAWKYWTQMSQFQFFYFHLKMQLAHMNQMLQLRQRQLLDVQNRLLDARFDQDSGVTAARLVPLAALDEIIATPTKSDSRLPVVVSLPSTPAAVHPAPVTTAEPTPTASDADLSENDTKSVSVAGDVAPETPPYQLEKPVDVDSSIRSADVVATDKPSETQSHVPVSSTAVPTQEGKQQYPFQNPPEQPAPAEERPSEAPVEPLVEKGPDQVVVAQEKAPKVKKEIPAPAPPVKKSPFLNSKPSTPVPAPATFVDLAPSPIPALKISPSAESVVKESKPEPQTGPEAPPTTQPNVFSPKPKPSDRTVQNLMERLERAAAEGSQTPTQQASATADAVKPEAAAPKVAEKPSLPEAPKSVPPAPVLAAPAGKPPLAPPSTIASPAPASEPTLVKKSPFLLADKQRQSANNSPTPTPSIVTASPKRPTLTRAQTIAPSSPSSSSSSPSPSPSPAKTHRRAPSESGLTIVESLSPQPTPESSPTKAPLTRKTSGGLLLKPASSTVPGMFSLSGMTSPGAVEVVEPPKSPRSAESPSPPLSESDGTSSGRTTPSPSASPAPWDDDVARARKSRPGSGIIDWSKIDNNLKPVAAARPSDNLMAPVQKASSVRALLSRSNSLAKPDPEGK